MTKDKALNTVKLVRKHANTAANIIAWSAGVGLIGAAVALGMAKKTVEANEQGLAEMQPRVRAVEREISGMAAKQDAMHEDIKEIKRFIIGARRER
jgi:uncharacterized protein YoxC